MREMILQQNESLLERVDLLTEERRASVIDRRNLLDRTGQLLEQLEDAEMRIGARDSLANESQRLESAQQNLASEVERLRRSNGALIQQVLGEEAEGPLAGCLDIIGGELDDTGDPGARDTPLSAAQELYKEVGRLILGQLPRAASKGSSIQADASALALRLQQTLAEREEAFWVERQRLSDRVTALERTRGGRTGALLRSYGAAAEGKKVENGVPVAPALSGSLATVSDGAASVASSAKDAFARLRGAF